MSFFGHEGTVYAAGVVEDRHDPEKLGRVRVRWLGIHTEDKQNILTKDLPWSQVVQPATGHNHAGIGHNSNILEGTWVFGIAKDPDLLQDWMVLGVLPGLNTRTAYRGGKGRSWNKARGDLKKIQESYDPATPDSEKTYIDYEKGFYDPTTDLRNVPWPPSTASYGNPVADHTFTPKEKHPDLSLEDTDKKQTRVPNYSDAVGGDHPSLLDLDGEEAAQWEYETTKAPEFTRATHSDVLHALYKTTRRLTADKRFLPEWTHFGTFRWPDANTYTKPGSDEEPEGQEPQREWLGDFGDRKKGREGVILSTGYLEPDFWSEDREYGKTGGTYGPSFPVTRDTPTYIPTEDADVLGISPNDTRASWGQKSKEETGYWSLDGEDYRVPNPRVRWVRKEHLTPTEEQTVKELFDAGHYGTGIYNVSDPEADDSRKDIRWEDVSNDDLVVVPTPDTNTLAMGGIPIESCDGKTVTTKSSLWADKTTYFSDPGLSRGEPAKPLIQKGDIVQITGVRGMQEINGRVFRLIGCEDKDGSFTMKLGTKDGKVWSGPGDKAVDNENWSEYLGGGVVIPHNPHWMLCWKADMRERQINIGSPDPETGVNAMHWNQPTGDFNARYPYNNVYESESGHIMEYDDTPGAERIHQFHRSGTHYEIDHNGTRTNYVKGDNYDIRLHDDYVYVKGKVVHTFDDEVMIRYNDRAEISAAWKLQLWSGGDLDIHSKRNINFKADGDINMQADGHINLHGTGVTAEQTDEYRAGSRNMKERSKIRMKAGHIELEAIGDETKPKQYGIFAQSNQAPMGLKTLAEGDAGDIHIAAGEDLELFAWKNQYRQACQANIYDYVYGDYRLGVQNGDIHVYATTGKEIHKITQTVDITSCQGDIKLNAPYDIEAIPPATQYGNIYLNTGRKIEAQSEREISLYSESYLNLISWGEGMLQTLGGPLGIKAKSGCYDDGKEEGQGMIDMQADVAVNIAPTPNFGQASVIEAEIPTPIDTEASQKSETTWIPETMELLSIDLPNPRPAAGTSVTQLALNANNLEAGIGGENIRNLHDTIENLQEGLSAYVTKMYPSTSDKKVYIEDQSEMIITGVSTHDLESPWNGYEAKNKTVRPLGVENAKRFTAVPALCDTSEQAAVIEPCRVIPPMPCEVQFNFWLSIYSAETFAGDGVTPIFLTVAQSEATHIGVIINSGEGIYDCLVLDADYTLTDDPLIPGIAIFDFSAGWGAPASGSVVYAFYN